MTARRTPKTPWMRWLRSRRGQGRIHHAFVYGDEHTLCGEVVDKPPVAPGLTEFHLHRHWGVRSGSPKAPTGACPACCAVLDGWAAQTGGPGSHDRTW